MKQWLGMPVVGALLLSACVTINVYFPAAEAKEAAREFVEKQVVPHYPEWERGGRLPRDVFKQMGALGLLGLGALLMRRRRA